MRISDDRYSRDRLRVDVALHFIRHEARTHTIREWTGLTDDRIRKLYRSYLHEGGRRVPRHRGKSPRQAAYFMSSARLRQETAALAGVYCLLGLLDGRSRQAPPQATAVTRAAALCQAYAVYRAIVGAPAIDFEHAVLLITLLAGGRELRVAGCHGCGTLVIRDALALGAPRCVLCSEPPAPAGAAMKLE